MKEYKFSDNAIQHIVDGILKGYKSYLVERKEKSKTLIVSSAYAWVKGNHIDHYVKMECDKLGINFKKAKAGYTWGYLQFKNEDDRIMFILKNTSTISDTMPTSKNKFDEEINYINKLSEINNDVTIYGKPIKKESKIESKPKQLNIWGTDLEIEEEVLKQKFKRFYIIAYSIDSETKWLSDIQLILPDPATKTMYRIDSWKKFIGTSKIEFLPEEFDAVRNERDPEEKVADGSYDLMDISVEKNDGDI
ncbi:hypothetical protein ABEX53_29515 [Bacillus toyonensis]|uniref:spr1630 family ClpXP-sensitive toxin n=1 Tax=Bacillus toyonensis TaxID=155322 RepID=UPI0002E8BCE9|nr:hypothetical protein [Bacillus toyonensis]MED3539314.1 hypothetical protein [Bacillus toyonensis]MEE2022149.1 hypothetical protein [Bacillus toyonensis]